ncbi:glycosyltransferase family A protein [Flavobacterium gillisiae]|nr:glycosyltransferase family A protein [Flavobacterium gillisiae]
MKSNVTVIIPCYNDGRYIVQALQSIFNQTVLPEKIIIVDDGSNAETQKVLASIQHSLVQVFYQENQGVSVARNNAITLAQTDFIVNLDADDFYEPTFIEKAAAVLLTNEAIGAVGCFYKTLENNILNTVIVKPSGGAIKHFLVKNSSLGTCMYRKKCWEQAGGFDEKMIDGYEDWEFWISVLKQDWTMHIIEEPLFVYRVKNTSRDRSALVNHDFELRKYIYTKHKEVYEEYREFYILELLRQNSMFRNTAYKIKRDVDYRIGYNLLKPLRFLKKVFSR